MPNVSVIFDAQTGQFVTSVDGMTKSVKQSAEAVASAKNSILTSFKEQIKSAQEVGASANELAAIQRRAAQTMANVTETNTSRVVAAYDRVQAKQKAIAESMASLNMAAPLVKAGDSAEYAASKFQRSQAAMQALRGNLTRNSRAAESFIATLGPLSNIISYAFPVIGAVALIAVVAEGTAKLKEMWDAAKQIPSALAQGFASINQPLAQTADELHKNNDQLQSGIDKLEHKPTNNLALALDDDIDRADKLAQSATKASDAIEKLLKDQNVSAVSSLFTNQAETGPIATRLKQGFADIASASNEDDKQFRFDSSPMASADAQKNAEEKHQQRLDAIQKQRQRMQDYIRTQRANINGPATFSYLDPTTGAYVATRNGQILGQNQQANNNLLNGSEDVLDSQSELASESQRNTTLTGQKSKLDSDKSGNTDANQAAAKRLKSLEAYVAMWQTQSSVSAKAIYDFWDKQRQTFTSGSKQFDAIIDAIAAKQAELAKAGAERASKAIAMTRSGDTTGANDFLTGHKEAKPDEGQAAYEEGNKGLDKWRADAAKQQQDVAKVYAKSAISQQDIAAKYNLASAAIEEQTGKISKLDAAQQRANINTQTYLNQLAQLNDALSNAKTNGKPVDVANAQVAIDKAASQRQIDVQADAAATAAATWQGALNDAFDNWLQHATDVAGQLSALLTTSLNGANKNLVDLMSGDYKKGDWAKEGHNLFKSGAGDALGNAEGKAASALGINIGKPDGSQGRPLYVKMADAVQHTIAGIGSGIGNLMRTKTPAPPGAAAGLLGTKSPAEMTSMLWPDGAPSMPSVNGDGGSTSSITPASTTNQVLGGIIKGVGGLFGAIFGGGRALGGGVEAGVTYRTGEMGPEDFTPSVPGYITPASKSSSNGNAYYNVSVANGVTPEQFDMKMQSALAQYHPHAMKAAVQHVNDSNRRKAA